jgi:hypothetical protein
VVVEFCVKLREREAVKLFAGGAIDFAVPEGIGFTVSAGIAPLIPQTSGISQGAILWHKPWFSKELKELSISLNGLILPVFSTELPCPADYYNLPY